MMDDCYEKTRETIERMMQQFSMINHQLEPDQFKSIRSGTSRELSLLPVVLEGQKILDELFDYLSHPHLERPIVDADNLWRIIESHSETARKVIEGTSLIEKYIKTKMESIIQPTDYYKTIQLYAKWQEETVRCFTKKHEEKPKTLSLQTIEYMWDWNNREQETLFFSGAARPLHLKTVTDFSYLLSTYYDRTIDVYKNNRHELSGALKRLLTEQSKKYWPDYENFPLNDSTELFDKILYYVFFRDREHTWFIQSSAFDYMPYIHSARETFADKFIGSNMTHREQHNTHWILKNLIEKCHEIYRANGPNTEPTIIILLSLKTRFGDFLDIDFIHQKLTQQFRGVVTIVDGCQSARALTEPDIILHSKRFSTTGAFALLNKTFILKNPFLERRLRPSTSFPITIIAQIYFNLYLINSNLSHGVFELVNSAWWSYTTSPVADEIRKTFGCDFNDQQHVVIQRHPIVYTFSYDKDAIILTIVMQPNNSYLLSKLWACLQQRQHIVDCFVLENPYLNEAERIDLEHIQDLIGKKFISALRHLESTRANILTWPLIPCDVSSPDDVSVDQMKQYFHTCIEYSTCLRLFFGRCGYPGKLKRFVQLLDNIVKHELSIKSKCLSTYSSQWPL